MPESHSGMYACLSCGHFITFHKPRGGMDPCYLCPPLECLVRRCKCSKYEGTMLTDRPHMEHLSMRVRFGSWGPVLFSTEEDRTFVSGAEPPVERAGIRFHPST